MEPPMRPTPASHAFITRITTAWIGVVALSLTARADNGARMDAPVAPPLTVDGRLDDWPKDLLSHSISNYYIRAPLDQTDFQAQFRAVYDASEGHLYVAVEVIDDSHVEEQTLDINQDMHVLYVDAQHSPRGSAPIGYSTNGTLHAIESHSSNAYFTEQEFSWDPAVEGALWGDTEVAVRRDSNRATYEWKVDVGEALVPGRFLGFDYEIVDRDAGDPMGEVTLASWGQTTDKNDAAFRLGDLYLLDAPLGELVGHVQWDDGTRASLPDQVKIMSLENPACWTRVDVNSDGVYLTSLPPGTYSIEPEPLLWTEQDQVIRVSDGLRLEESVVADDRSRAAPLRLTQKPHPELLEEEGVLFELDDDDLPRVDQFMGELMSYYQIPGASLALVHDAELAYSQAYGVANELTQAPVEEDTLFEAASITKPVFAFAVNRLVERGVIDLDRPLHEYLPYERVAHDPRAKLITARHVLSHRTGFPNWADNELGSRIPVQFTPGTRYQYSGEGFEYLGMVVERLTGKPLVQVLDEEVRQPFGITANMEFAEKEGLLEQLAVGHYGRQATPYRMPERPGMAWSMMTEAKAFAKFMIGLLNEEHLESDSYAEMFRGQSDVPPDKNPRGPQWDSSYSLGFSIQFSPYGTVVQHGGNNGDFRCMFQNYHELACGYVVFTNNDYGEYLAQALHRFLIMGQDET